MRPADVSSTASKNNTLRQQEVLRNIPRWLTQPDVCGGTRTTRCNEHQVVIRRRTPHRRPLKLHMKTSRTEMARISLSCQRATTLVTPRHLISPWIPAGLSETIDPNMAASRNGCQPLEHSDSLESSLLTSKDDLRDLQGRSKRCGMGRQQDPTQNF